METLGKIFDAVGLAENIGREQQLFDKHADASVDLAFPSIKDDAASKQRMVNMCIDHIPGFFVIGCFHTEHVPHNKDCSLSLFLICKS